MNNIIENYGDPRYGDVIKYLVKKKMFEQDDIDTLISTGELTLRDSYDGSDHRRDPGFCLNLRTVQGDIQTKILRRLNPKEGQPKDQHLGKSGGSYILFQKKIDPTKPVLISEGVTDTIRAWSLYKDTHNIIGVPGVSNIGRLIKELDQLGTITKVDLLIDNDEAAQNTILKCYGQQRYSESKMVIYDCRQLLQEEKDLDDAYGRYGHKALEFREGVDIQRSESIGINFSVNEMKKNYSQHIEERIEGMGETITTADIKRIRGFFEESTETEVENTTVSIANFVLAPHSIKKNYEYNEYLKKDIYKGMDVYCYLIGKDTKVDYTFSSHKRAGNIKKLAKSISGLYIQNAGSLRTADWIISKARELAHYLSDKGLIEVVESRTHLGRTEDRSTFVSSDELIDIEKGVSSGRKCVVENSKLEIGFERTEEIFEMSIEKAQEGLGRLHTHIFNKTDITDVYLGFLGATLFQPEIRKKTRGFPILFIQGVTNSGKSYSAELLSRIAGAKYDNRSIVSDLTTTPYVLAQHFNANRHLLFIDEVNEGCQTDTVNLIKSSFDGNEVEKGRSYNKGPGIETWTTKLALIVASESLPQNNSLYNRGVVVYVDQSLWNDDEFKAKSLSADELVENFGPYYAELLVRKRQINFSENFQIASDIIEVHLKNRELQPERRVIENLKTIAFGLQITARLDANNLGRCDLLIRNYNRNLKENATSYDIISHIVNNPSLYYNPKMKNDQGGLGNPKVFVNHKGLYVVPKAVGTVFKCKTYANQNGMKKVINEFCHAIGIHNREDKKNVDVFTDKRTKMCHVDIDTLKENQQAREIFLAVAEYGHTQLVENKYTSRKEFEELRKTLRKLDGSDRESDK